MLDNVAVSVETFGIVFAILFAGFCAFFISKKPKSSISVSYASTPLNKSIVDDCTLLSGVYEPCPWMIHPVFHSAAGVVIRYPPPQYETFVARGPTGQTFGCDYVSVQNKPKGIVVILTGVTGHSGCGYISQVAAEVAKHDKIPIVVNYPGMKPDSTVESKPYSMRQHDLPPILEQVQNKFGPDLDIFLLGFSMGGSVWMRFLQSENVPSYVKGAFIVSCPWNLKKTYGYLLGSAARRFLIEKHFLGRFKDFYQRFKDLFHNETELDHDAIVNAKTCAEFHVHCTGPVNKIRITETDQDEFFNMWSSHQAIHNVKIPTLVCTSEDDPIVPTFCVPFEELEQNPNIISIKTKLGGHAAWLEGWIPFGVSWVDRVAVQYFNTLASK